MSETTLSAEAARAMTLLVMASRVDPNLRSAVADVETYVAELQREIEGYRQALADAADHMMWMLGGWDDRHDDALPRAHEGIGKALVLAGKEAQG